MKFSVLLPTRNRLDLLKYAIQSVLDQDYDLWEIIVYDNCSEEDIEGYIRSIDDSRVKYYRSPRYVSVTENWNNTIEKASGDYMIMLGDDDCLLKGYFKRMLQLLKDYPDPDFVYTSALIYAYPGVLPNHPEGFLQAFGNALFIHNKMESFYLNKNETLRYVKNTLDFRLQFSFNMQYSLISWKFYDRCKIDGKFFHSPYPDYYATTLMMIKAERILVYPFTPVVIGISEKSYGYYHFNNKEKEGIQFLNNKVTGEYPSLQNIILPGLEMNTFWLMAMESLKINFKNQGKLNVNYSRYKQIQAVKVYKDWVNDKENSLELLRLFKAELKGIDKLYFGVCYHLFFLAFRLGKRWLGPALWSNLRSRVYAPSYSCQSIEGEYSTIEELYKNIDPDKVRQKI